MFHTYLVDSYHCEKSGKPLDWSRLEVRSVSPQYQPLVHPTPSPSPLPTPSPSHLRHPGCTWVKEQHIHIHRLHLSNTDWVGEKLLWSDNANLGAPIWGRRWRRERTDEFGAPIWGREEKEKKKKGQWISSNGRGDGNSCIFRWFAISYYPTPLGLNTLLCQNLLNL